MSGKVIDKELNLSLRQRYLMKIGRVNDNDIINIHGKIFMNNNPVNKAIVVVYHKFSGEDIFLASCTTDEDGEYCIELKENFYYGMMIEITSYKNTVFDKTDLYQIKYDIDNEYKENTNPEKEKDIILFGKIKNSNGQGVSGALVAAFCDVDKLINHTFTDVDGFYMINIKYDLYKDKKIIIRSTTVNSKYK